MKHYEIKQQLYALKVILVGLFAAQFIGTIHVYISNKNLYQNMQMVSKAGYLAVPNEHVWQALQSLLAAFMGGVFFTLSLGTGLAVAGLICAWSWDRLFRRSNTVLVIILTIWGICLAAINANGVSVTATVYLLLIAPLTFVTALLLLPPRLHQKTLFYNIIRISVPACLILLFLPLAGVSIFHDFRDAALLSNPIGRKINSFYYDNTLYAAEAIKSLGQKTIRTCRLTLTENASHRATIEQVFLSMDYLVINGEGPADLSVFEQNGNLLFRQKDRPLITVPLPAFTAKPSSVLRQYAKKTDRFKPLRLAAFASIIVGLPVCLYIITQGLFFLVLRAFFNQKRAAYSALFSCLLIGIFITLPVYSLKTTKVNRETAYEALASEKWQSRVAALRYMAAEGLSGEKLITGAQQRLASPHIAERYWFVRALASSRSPEAGKVLLAALDDSNSNVVCMAYYSLGKRKETAASREIIKRLGLASSWYEQVYAYKALRSMGWRQKKS